MIIRHNLPAMGAANALWRIGSEMSKTLEKLSSGYRVNRAADDAAGLGISQKMRAEIKGLEIGMLNIENGVSIAQTGDGGLEEVSSLLLRARSLALQACNGIYEEQDRSAITAELGQITDEIDRIAKSTNVNHIFPLNMKAGAVSGNPMFPTNKPSAPVEFDYGPRRQAESGGCHNR